MKYKILSILLAVAVLAGAAGIHYYEPPHNRYHQHLQARQYTPDLEDRDFSTHLPLMSIQTEDPIPDPYQRDKHGNALIKDGYPQFNNEMVYGSFCLFDSAVSNNHLDDVPTVEENVRIRVRGNSSRKFAKSSYIIKFVDNNLVDSKAVSLCGMTADNTWILHGPFMDRALIRNYMMYNLAGEIMDYAPNVRFFELFLNGEYEGLYLLTEKINYNPEGRIKITTTDPDALDTSYIICADSAQTDSLHQLETFADFSGKRGLFNHTHERLEILYPGKTLTEPQKQKIAYDLSCFEKALSSFDSHDPKKGYPAYIDVDEFVDYFILNEFSMNSDAGLLSTYFYKDVRGKIKPVCWDFNNAFNNYYTDLSQHRDFYNSNLWYKYLLRSSRFVDEIVKRYHHLRKTYLSNEYLMNYIDETLAYLGPAIERNNERWGKYYDLESLPYEEYRHAAALRPIERNPADYAGAVQNLKNEILAHGQFLDENIEALYARCHDSTNKQFKLEGED